MGRQWLGNIGKTENGVVSVSSLWAEEEVYYPLEVEPYTPAHHFGGGKDDPKFRTKLKIAGLLVERSVAMGVGFRAVVADSFYGEDREFSSVPWRARVSWSEALRAVRGWLEPWIMLWRYWRAFTDLPPPPELKALLERMFSGEGLYLYVH